MRRTPVPSLLVVTVVAALIWTWAASETRETTTMTLTLQWTTADEAQIATPAEMSVEVEMQGSRIALQDARSLLGSPVLIALPAEAANNHSLDLIEALNQHPDIREARVTVGSVKPPMVDLRIDTIETHVLQVRPPTLPGVETEGPVEVEPQEVTIHVPSSLQNRLPDALDCDVDRIELDRLSPGQLVRMRATLRLREPFASNPNVRVEPPTASVKFTVRSNIRQTTLPTVNVLIGGPWQDHEEYTIEIDEADRVLRDVVVSADGALIDRIEAQEVKVIAMVYLSTQDKERGIASKRVAKFVAVLPNDTWDTQISAEVNGDEQPLIQLTITEREAPAVE